MRIPAPPFRDPQIISFLRITTLENGSSVYLEIYRRLRHLIKTGVLTAGDSLPSEAELSSTMCVGRTSLRTALSLLYEDGYIETARGRGSYVIWEPDRSTAVRDFPGEILLPRDRLSLLGPATVHAASYTSAASDGYLIDMLNTTAEGNVMLLQQLFCLNDTPAILSQSFFEERFLSASRQEDPRRVADLFSQAVYARACTAQCECIPIKMVNPTGLSQYLARGIQFLVTTQYVGAQGEILAFSKDYYNSDLVRFRFSLKK